MTVEFIDVLQSREYNEKTGHFHDRICRGNRTTTSAKLLCHATDRTFTPFFKFIHKVYDFDSDVPAKDSVLRPRPTIKELRELWNSYLSLCMDITYYKNIKTTDAS